MGAQITELRLETLHFDYQNPRLAEYNITNKTPEKEVINMLWDLMAVEEIVLSILAHGFFENEAMLAVEEDGKYIIVEGNRRLAAVKAIVNPELITNKGMVKYSNRITSQLKEDLEGKLPVMILNNRAEAWRFIGFKHVNGAAKWGGYAKAHYIASVRNNQNISLDEIAEQIGDTNKTVQKLYQGLMFIEQAERETDFKRSDIQQSQLPFSHLYTAIQYNGYREFLGIDGTEISEHPVKEDKLPQLEELMIWLFGSKSKNQKPVIKTQNPDLRNLNTVLRNREATQALRTSNDLTIAYELTFDESDVLYDSMVKAKVSLQKAASKVSSYKGEEDTLKLSGSIANIAESLYDSLERIKEEKEKKSDGKKKRLSE